MVKEGFLEEATIELEDGLEAGREGCSTLRLYRGWRTVGGWR